MAEAVKTPSDAAQDTGVEKGSPAPETTEIDYAAELQVALEAQAKAEKERDNYKKGLLKAKGKLPAESDTEEEDVLDIADKVAARIIPVLQTTFTKDQTEALISEMTSDPNEQRLIKFHLENTVAPTGSLKDRIENARLIANKKKLLTETRELKVALANRAQLSTTGQGTSSEGQKVQDRFFSDEQIAALKKRGFDDKKIELLKKNLRKNG